MRKNEGHISLFDLFAGPIDEAFSQYHAAHPEVYASFCAIALGLIRRGHQHYSADAILHVIRYKVAIKKDVLSLCKINNNFTSRYARKFMRDYPKHEGFFETRVLKTDNQ